MDRAMASSGGMNHAGPHSREKRVLIIGAGQAGLRFLRACLSFNARNGSLKVVGIVEPDDTKLNSLRNLGIRTFKDVLSASRLGAIDIAIVAVPELQHFAVLKEIRQHFHGRVRILCEKPLAANLSEARALRTVVSPDDLTLNFVERLSSCVAELLKFIRTERRHVVRATSFWGKYRLKDQRPTPGVLSDLAHPLDLVLFLSDTQPHTAYKIASTIAISSNFNIGAVTADALETVHVAMEFETGLQYVAASSYAWSERTRRIEILLADRSNRISELAFLEFDKPIWDSDRLEIYNVREFSGKKSLVLKRQAEDVPPELKTIGKVYSFIEENLNEMGGISSRVLPHLEQGIYVQQILDDITRSAELGALSSSKFAEPGGEAPSALNKNDTLERLAGGEDLNPEALIWDDVY